MNLKKGVVYGIVEADLTPSTVLSAGIEHQRHKTTGAGDAFSGAPIFFGDGSRTNFGHGTNLTADWGYTMRESTGPFSTLEHYFDNEWRLGLDVEHTRHEYDMELPYVTELQPDGSGSFLAFRWHGKPAQDSVTLHANGPYELFGRRHEAVVGGSYMRGTENGLGYNDFYDSIPNAFEVIRTGHFPRQDLSPTGGRYSFHDVQSGLYAATRLKLADPLSVIVGSRLSNWKTRTDRIDAAGVATRGPTSKESNVLTPYAGVVFDLTESLSVYGSYTDIFQPSTRYDARGQLLDPAEGSNHAQLAACRRLQRQRRPGRPGRAAPDLRASQDAQAVHQLPARATRAGPDAGRQPALAGQHQHRLSLPLHAGQGVDRGPDGPLRDHPAPERHAQHQQRVRQGLLHQHQRQRLVRRAAQRVREPALRVPMKGLCGGGRRGAPPHAATEWITSRTRG